MYGETEWYVIDIKSNTIVNCVTCSGPKPDMSSTWPPAQYRLDSNPPLAMLEQYRYWNERP